jgi:hypothetical protein
MTDIAGYLSCVGDIYQGSFYHIWAMYRYVLNNNELYLGKLNTVVSKRYYSRKYTYKERIDLVSSNTPLAKLVNLLWSRCLMNVQGTTFFSTFMHHFDAFGTSFFA